jgi:hypothetical protein
MLRGDALWPGVSTALDTNGDYALPDDLCAPAKAGVHLC